MWWLFGIGGMSDHDRLLLLEQELRIRLEQWNERERGLVEDVTGIASRLEQGNRTFRDNELFQQRVEKELSALRDTTGAARLSADNASRAFTQLARTVDERTGVAEKARAEDQEAMEEAIRVALEHVRKERAEAVKRVDDKIEALEKTIEEWKIRGTMIRTFVMPAVTIALTIATAFALKYFGF